MKKSISILMVFLVLAAMFNLTVATHYCGGRIADSKISVSGKLATCGMEGSGESNRANGTLIRTHCCEDIVMSYNIDNNYTPSFAFISESLNYSINNFFTAADVTLNYRSASSHLCSDASPPGCMMSTDVDLSDICVFRI